MEPIAAISTAQAVSAIGIVRLSGDGAFPIADAVFRPTGGGPLSAHPRREMVLGAVLDREGRTIDQALAVTVPQGGSYTGEASVEFHCHGSPLVLNQLLQALFAAGARQALGGEFTKRAFLSGNLDLTQAEAVIDLIEAETADAARNAVGQLNGSLRQRIDPVYEALLDVSSRFYAVVDYPDEDIEDLELETLQKTLAQSEAALAALAATFPRGQVLKNGVATAIVGRPNAGKSSLLNALVGFERAIVTDIAGTTRDTVEEKALVGGVLLRLIDTAGIRDTGDQVERLGVERSRSALEAAGLAFAVVDGSQPLTEEDRQVLALVAGGSAPWILVWSKADLDRGPLPALPPLEGKGPAAVVSLSSLTGAGIDQLEQAVAALFPTGGPIQGQLLTNPRQAEAVERALASLRGAKAALSLTPDAALTDVEAAMHALGELTGRTVRDDLVERIFSRFCVGK